ncbi:MAG: hypothetical protein R3F48_14065 [Candidatus Zixiibacteriota bacterium]
MGKERIIYRNWIVDLGYDPANPPDIFGGTVGYNQSLICAVDRAVNRLTADEADFIQRFYYQGQTYREIGQSTGRDTHNLEALHNRAVKRLRVILASSIQLPEAEKSAEEQTCPLCRHKHAAEINELISTRDKRETWRPIIRILKEKYNLRVSTPQLLIGHTRYHIKKEDA